MSIFVSPEAKRAYDKIAGGFDSTMSAYKFASKGVQTVSENDALKMKLKAGDKFRKGYEYYNAVKDVLDQSKRQGAILKLGLKISIDVAEKTLGASLSTHPYFTYHKAALEALADALNASNNNKQAIAAFNTAVAAADKSAALTDRLKDMGNRKGALYLQYLPLSNTLRLELEVEKGVLSKTAADEIAESGLSREALRESIADLVRWRANWAGLLFDGLQLLDMTEIEFQAAREAMDRFRKTIDAMKAGSNMSRVAGYAAEQQQQWEQYDRMVNPKSGQPEQSVVDPVKFAASNRDRVETAVQGLAKMFDFSMSGDVVVPGRVSAAMNDLNKALRF